MIFRKALQKDLEKIIEILGNDPLGKLREDLTKPLSTRYIEAFKNIQKDPNQELMVIEERGEIIATFQLSFIQYLTYQGGKRAQIEAVRLHEDYRGKGIGQKLIEWAVERARQQGAHLLQLTTDKQRPDAIRFYEKLGFKASHEGMKLHFDLKESSN